MKKVTLLRQRLPEAPETSWGRVPHPYWPAFGIWDHLRAV